MSLISLARWCDSKMGLPYSTANSRFGYTRPEHYDCSGFVWRGCNDNGFALTASVSYTIQQEGERKGLTCTRGYAETHIAIAVHGGDTPAGGGVNGHVCFTDGRGGGTWEAMGTRAGCRKGQLANRFEYYMRLPGEVDLPPAPPPVIDWESVVLALRREDNSLKDNPAIISPAPGRQDIFCRGTDNALWHCWAQDGSWRAWESLGGKISEPWVSATSSSPTQIEIVIRGFASDGVTPGGLFAKAYTTAGWGPWQPLGGQYH